MIPASCVALCWRYFIVLLLHCFGFWRHKYFCVIYQTTQLATAAADRHLCRGPCLHPSRVRPCLPRCLPACLIYLAWPSVHMWVGWLTVSAALWLLWRLPRGWRGLLFGKYDLGPLFHFDVKFRASVCWFLSLSWFASSLLKICKYALH